MLSVALFAGAIHAQDQPKASAKPIHKWVNEPTGPLPAGVSHHTFHSASMGINVGYCIYLPPEYSADSSVRYPVVYWLHGGSGNELSGVSAVAPIVDQAIRTKEIPPLMVVFINGGPEWHYDMPELKVMGETAFIGELIPFVDKNYRTLADRRHRAIEGMSMGGRGTARNMFKYAGLFCSAAPVAAGFGNEQKAIDAGLHLDNNVFSLARKYAAGPSPSVRILIIVGTKDPNYPSTLEYMKFLDGLKIPYDKIILEGVTHNNREYYQHLGSTTLRFHAESFRRASESSSGN